MIWIFILKRQLLIQERSYKSILGLSVLLFVAGVALHFARAEGYSSAGALLAPILTLVLFRICRRVFLQRYKHEPKDTFLNWDTGLGPDKVFDFFYFMAAICLLMILSIGVEELAKAGW